MHVILSIHAVVKMQGQLFYSKYRGLKDFNKSLHVAEAKASGFFKDWSARQSCRFNKWASYVSGSDS